MVVTLMKRFQTKIVLVKPRTPRTQGLVEQANGVVETRLAKWKYQTDRSDWSNSLPEIAMSINRTVHSATKHTPFELVFGRKDFPKPVLTQQELILEDEDGIPIDMNDPTKDLEDESETQESQNTRQEEETIETLAAISSIQIQRVANSQKMTDIANTNLVQSRNRMGTKYSKSKSVRNYQKGDRVSLFIPKEDRAPTDVRRMFCFVIDTPKDDRYQLCSSNGRLNRLYCTKDLEPVPDNVDMGFHLDEAMEKPVTTLHATAKANSSALFMTIRCKCKKGCVNR